MHNKHEEVVVMKNVFSMLSAVRKIAVDILKPVENASVKVCKKIQERTFIPIFVHAVYDRVNGENWLLRPITSLRDLRNSLNDIYECENVYCIISVKIDPSCLVTKDVVTTLPNFNFQIHISTKQFNRFTPSTGAFGVCI